MTCVTVSSSFDGISFLQVRDPAPGSLLARGSRGQCPSGVSVCICESGKLRHVLWPEQQLESNITFLQ